MPPELGLNGLSILQIREYYQTIIFKQNQTLLENFFLQWFYKNFYFGRFNGDSKNTVDYINNQYYRIFDVVVVPHEAESLSKFEKLSGQILEGINQKLGTNYGQTFSYLKSDQSISANWEIDGEKILWSWGKDFLLELLRKKDIRHLTEIYMHELTHVFEGFIKNNLIENNLLQTGNINKTHDQGFF